MSGGVALRTTTAGSSLEGSIFWPGLVNVLSKPSISEEWSRKNNVDSQEFEEDQEKAGKNAAKNQG